MNAKQRHVQVTSNNSFYTSQQYVYDLLCFEILVSTMYYKMVVFIFVTGIETNNTNTTHGDC